MSPLSGPLVFAALAAAHAQPDPMQWTPLKPFVNPAASCITDLCGPPAQSANFLRGLVQAWQDYAVANAGPAAGAFPPDLQKLIDQTEVASRETTATFASKFKSGAAGADQNLKGTVRALYALMQSQSLGQYVRFKASPGGDPNAVVLDEAATRAALKALPPADREWALGYAKTITKVNSYPVSQDTVRTQPPALTLTTLHPGVGLAEASKLEYARTTALLGKVDSANILERATFFDEIKPERLRQIGTRVADGSATEDDLRAMTLWNMSQSSLGWYLRDPASPLLHRKTPPLDTIIRAAGGADQTLRKFNDGIERETAKEAKQLRACHRQYFINKRMLPTEAERQNLARDVERAKANLRDLVKERFSGEERAKAIASIDATNFILPPSATSYEASFRDVLAQRLDASQRGLADARRMTPSEVRQTVAALSTTPSGDDTDDEGETNAICGAYNFLPLSDANYTANGSVLLSYVTARGPAEFRMGVIMHELGHGVSKALRELSPTMHGRTTCVGRFHADLPAVLTGVTGLTPEGKYVEEDFADELPDRARSAGSGKNWVCPLLALTYDQQAYQDLSLVNENPRDDHSSTLFRLLHAESARAGHLPESCDSFVAKSPVKPNFLDCLGTATSADASAGSAR